MITLSHVGVGYRADTPSTGYLGGTVEDCPTDATAFRHQEKPYMLNFEANWGDPADDANVA